MIKVMLHSKNTSIKSAEKGWGFDAPFCPATISPHLHRRTEGRILAIHPACPPGQGRGADHSRSSLREFHIFEYVHFWENKVVTTGQQRGYVVEANVMFAWINMVLLFQDCVCFRVQSCPKCKMPGEKHLVHDKVTKCEKVLFVSSGCGYG